MLGPYDYAISPFSPDGRNTAVAGARIVRSTSIYWMDLDFIGTRGEIDVAKRRHRRHSALLVSEAGARIIIDCGTDWRRRIGALRPTAIVLTHGHPDHAEGLADGAPCPVYATEETWELLAAFPIAERRVVPLRRIVDISGLLFEAFPVEHSVRAPAVGYRITARQRSFFYVPDVVAIHDRSAALRGADLYIGDGATITRPMVRRRGEALIGHTPIRVQLEWCRTEAVPRAIFTHCGSQIVAGDERILGPLVRQLGRERGVEASVAYDGMRLSVEEAMGSAHGGGLRRSAGRERRV